VQLFYEKKIVYDGIPGYRYKIGNNFLNELDDCFCTDRIKGTLKHDDGCLYSGAIDLYDCLGEFFLSQKISMIG
jgi:CD36 family